MFSSSPIISFPKLGTPKAFRTSAQPGLTQALSTRLKLSVDPLVYAFDTPGVMLPFLGYGDKGAERGVKLALIGMLSSEREEQYLFSKFVLFFPAGIKEGMYEMETLASYLLYRLNVLNPICKFTQLSPLIRHRTIYLSILAPAYLTLLPAGAEPTIDLEEFLSQLAKRMGMIKRGAELDLSRAAAYFVRWWREEGGILAASAAMQSGRSHPLFAVNPDGTLKPDSESTSITHGWGFDIQWQMSSKDFPGTIEKGLESDRDFVVQKMEDCIEQYQMEAEKEDKDESNISATQRKKQMTMEEKARRKMKHAKRKQWQQYTVSRTWW